MALAMWNRSGSLSPRSLSLKQLLLDMKAAGPFFVVRGSHYIDEALQDGQAADNEISSSTMY